MSVESFHPSLVTDPSLLFYGEREAQKVSNCILQAEGRGYVVWKGHGKKNYTWSSEEQSN